jgi:hypothetical protein
MDNFKKFLMMWVQLVIALGLIFSAVILVLGAIVGISLLFKVAGPLLGAIIMFVTSTLAATAWAWMMGERPQ